ncbi:MAG: arginine--tRNA ligase [Solirubrobacterales bacterium]
MGETQQDPLAALDAAVARAASALRPEGLGESRHSLERPPRPEMGDYSSNAAMLLAGSLGEPPREVAERLVGRLGPELGEQAERIEVAGPGFVNLHLSDAWFRAAIEAMAQGAALPVGEGPGGEPMQVLVEFVSANPTGPLTAASGRHAAYGDSVARLLEAVGNAVRREYYVNDTGGQIERFGASVSAAMRGEDPPEDGYRGSYVSDLGAELAAAGVDPGDAGAVRGAGVERMLQGIRATLARFGVSHDGWVSEASLFESGKVSSALRRLDQGGHTYESEGALWLRTTEFGDDKDRVLIRADGSPTYLAGDVAYHADKLERGFELLINVLGADHHGYVARLRAAICALGGSADSFEAQIMQLVHIVDGSERAQMSKRRGEFVTLDELVDDIGADATRFFMLQRSHDTTVDLDLDLARRQSSENPVYYVQYAHARIASIMRKAESGGAGAEDDGARTAPLEPAERLLVKRLLEFPGEVREAAGRRAPHRLCAYGMEVASDFHGFYRDCQVVGAGEPGVEASRLRLCLITRKTIARTLGLLGISAPDRM